MEPFNFEYVCADTIRNITVSFNLLNLLGALLLLMFLVTAYLRKIHWLLVVFVVAILLGAMYFVTLDIQYTKGCKGSLTYKTEYIPSWWHD